MEATRPRPRRPRQPQRSAYWGRKIRQVVCQIPARIMDEIRELPSHAPKDKEVVALIRHSRRRGDIPDVSYGIWDEKDEEARGPEEGEGCGRGALAMWPWVVQTAQQGFCECDMASWERTCWRCEWIAAGYPSLAW